VTVRSVPHRIAPRSRPERDEKAALGTPFNLFGGTAFTGGDRMASRWHYQDLQMREIGLVVRNFGWLEATVKQALCQYLELGVLKCFTLTAHLGFRQSLDLLWSLYNTDRKFQKKQRIELERLLKKAEEIERDRNEIVHSEWFPEKYKKGGIKLRQVKITSRKGLSISVVGGRNLSDVEAIHKIAERIYRLDLQLRRQLRLQIDDIFLEA
jgi:hypothetical protein